MTDDPQYHSVRNSIHGSLYKSTSVQAEHIYGDVNIEGARRTSRDRPLPPMRELPRCRGIEPVTAGVHHARAVEDGSSVPPYVFRDQDADLRRQVRQAGRQGGFVLVMGPSSVGKSRAALEAVRAVLPRHRFLAPGRDDDLASLPGLVRRRRRNRRVVLWLDDVEDHLGLDGVDRHLVNATVVRPYVRQSDDAQFVYALALELMGKLRSRWWYFRWERGRSGLSGVVRTFYERASGGGLLALRAFLATVLGTNVVLWGLLAAGLRLNAGEPGAGLFAGVALVVSFSVLTGFWARARRSRIFAEPSRGELIRAFMACPAFLFVVAISIDEYEAVYAIVCLLLSHPMLWWTVRSDPGRFTGMTPPHAEGAGTATGTGAS